MDENGRVFSVATAKGDLEVIVTYHRGDRLQNIISQLTSKQSQIQHRLINLSPLAVGCQQTSRGKNIEGK